MSNIMKILADAQGDIKNNLENNLPNTDGVGQGNLQNVLFWVYGAAGLAAVGVIIYGAIKYLTAQGDPGKTKQASSIIAYALIGLIIVMLAGAVTAFAINAIGDAK